MKRILSVLLIAILVFSFAACNRKKDEQSGVTNYAETTSYDVKDSTGKVLGTLEYVASGTEYATITKYTPRVSTPHSLYIPTTLGDGRTVTAIGSEAFKACSYVTKVRIPYTVQIIGDWAFSLCTSIYEISIPESVEIIGDGAFWGCEDLTYVTFDGDAPALKSIGSYAFGSCTYLDSITVPEGVTSIGDDAFDECLNLKTVTLPQSLKTLGQTVFARCDAVESITLGDNIESIGKYAFGTLLSEKPEAIIYNKGTATDNAIKAIPDAE